MILTASQLTDYASVAGWQGQDLRISVAIALAESGGETEALGDTGITAGGSIGLWQINLRWHPEWYNNSEALKDPLTNARAAYGIFQKQGFFAWSTFKNGLYTHFLEQK